MKKIISFTLPAVLVLGLMGCASRTDRVDSGGVILSVSDFDGLPVVVNMNSQVPPTGTGLVQVSTINLQSVVRDPTGTSSDLMTVELKSYQVTFSRIDGGNRVPPPYVRTILGNVTAGGSYTLNNLPVAGLEQLLNEPLQDLLYENGGYDQETGKDVITVKVSLKFYGETLSGDKVETQPVSWSIEFRQ